MSKMKTFKLGAIVAIVAGVFGLALVKPALAANYTCPTGTIRAGQAVANPTMCNLEKEEEGSGLMETVQTIINVALSVLGIVTVIMIIIGGVQYTTSAGDPGKATKGKNTIMYGVIGLIIALLAFAIVNFVLTSIFNGSGAGGGEGGGETPTSEEPR